MSELGDRIATTLRRERERRDLSVSELARRAGVAKATVSQLENGGGNPSVETLWALASAMEIPFAVLVDEGVRSPTLIRAGEGGTAVASLTSWAAFSSNVRRETRSAARTGALSDRSR